MLGDERLNKPGSRERDIFITASEYVLDLTWSPAQWVPGLTSLEAKRLVREVQRLIIHASTLPTCLHPVAV
jgi:hypothetical protein